MLEEAQAKVSDAVASALDFSGNKNEPKMVNALLDQIAHSVRD